MREAFVYACLYMYTKLAFGEKDVQTMVDHINKEWFYPSYPLILSVNYVKYFPATVSMILDLNYAMHKIVSYLLLFFHLSLYGIDFLNK